MSTKTMFLALLTNNLRENNSGSIQDKLQSS